MAISACRRLIAAGGEEIDMGWMAKILNFLCGLGGYSACADLSTYEAIILGGITLGVLYLVVSLILMALTTTK